MSNYKMKLGLSNNTTIESGTFTIPDDVNVTQSPNSTNANYPILFSPSTASTTANTGTVGKNSKILCNPSTGNISATTLSAQTGASTTTFTSNDVADGSATSWTNVTKLDSGITHANFFQRVSQMFKNVRYLYKKLGTTDISSISNGTVTGGLSWLYKNKPEIEHFQIFSTNIPITKKSDEGLYWSEHGISLRDTPGLSEETLIGIVISQWAGASNLFTTSYTPNPYPQVIFNSNIAMTLKSVTVEIFYIKN